MSETCGYTVIDSEGIEQPCDRPATGWRWYQDCGHEDLLEVACEWHRNRAGDLLARVREELTRWANNWDDYHFVNCVCRDYGMPHANEYRALLSAWEDI